MTATTYKPFWDKCSTSFSIICLIHCIVLPILFTTLPLLGIDIIENSYVEIATLLITFAIGSYAILRGYKYFHKNKMIIGFFVVGISFMIASTFFEGGIASPIIKIVGAIGVIAAHILNRKHCIAVLIISKINLI